MKREATFAKKLTEQFELMERSIDAEAIEVLGVKCRWCDFVVVDREEANQLLAIGGLPLLAVNVTVQGGLHWLVCKAPKGN